MVDFGIYTKLTTVSHNNVSAGKILPTTTFKFARNQKSGSSSF